ncbi:hemerythrin domain-containing protein [Paraherbaspirillum soli]|uniref:Hemerythrin domain-containing protein n=1 Tax=Paraherbaspirillum soli TaxID=631222 RepID=A0ABW0MC24_9BURK
MTDLFCSALIELVQHSRTLSDEHHRQACLIFATSGLLDKPTVTPLNIMLNSLIDTAPDFDQPIAVLKHCHERIRKQLTTLQKLLNHLQQHGVDAGARQAAASIMRYFNQAAPHHHADEEVDLLPMLVATAQDDDARLLDQLMPEILSEHAQMDKLWQTLNKQLVQIAGGEITDKTAALSAQDVNQFSSMYSAHMEKEEAWIAPMAKRIFSEEQMKQLGAAMQQRRGIQV